MAPPAARYDTYEDFLRAAICRYWESSYGSKVNFLALLFACREAWSVAWDKSVTRESGRMVLKGAAGAAAAAVLIRSLVGGPIGLILTGASVASLVAVYVKSHDRVGMQVERYRGLLADYRPEYEVIARDFREGLLRDGQRDLMMEGLVGRFLMDLDRDPEISGVAPAEPTPGSFAAHVARRERQG